MAIVACRSNARVAALCDGNRYQSAAAPCVVYVVKVTHVFEHKYSI